MNSFSLLAGIAGLALSSASLMAGTVAVSFTNDNKAMTQGGLLLQNGNAVRVGTFNLPTATRDATLAKISDYTQLKSWFRPLGEGIAGAGTVSQLNGSGNMLRVNGFPAAGNIFGGISNISDSYMAPGTPLYLWVFDNADPDKANQWGIFCGGSWVAPQGLGTQTISSVVPVSALQGGYTDGDLHLTVPAPCFGNWGLKNFAAGMSAADKLSTADPDGDGIANLAEYAWQLHPASKDTAPTSVAKDVSTGGSKFTFLVPRTLADVQVIAESSPDLKTWTTASSVVVASDASFNTCQCSLPAGAPKYFWRVRFTAVTPQ